MSDLALGKSVFGTDALSIPKLFSVDGWVAVVTGGGTGLGLITAATLAQNGCKVYIAGRRLEPLQEAAKNAKPISGMGDIIPVQADVSNKEGIQTLRAEVEKNEKWINLLVNNHGVSLAKGDLDGCEQTPEGISKEMFDNESFECWADTYQINCASYHFLSFAFLPLLAAAKTVGKFAEPGNIVNVASLSGITKTSQKGQFNYNASKAATRQLSQMLSTEFAHRRLGIRVNTINPGYFPSGMSVKEFTDNDSEASAKLFREKYGVPFARVGTALDYAQCIIPLVTNSYTTGADPHRWRMDARRSVLNIDQVE